MTTVTIGVTSREQLNTKFRRAMNGEPQGAFRGFETPDDLFSTLTPGRWAILRALTGAGPLSLGETARRLGQDTQTLESDVRVLVKAGLLEQQGDGEVEFPFDAVHVDFMLQAAS